MSTTCGPRVAARLALIGLALAAPGCGVSALTASLIATQGGDRGGDTAPPRVTGVTPPTASHGGGDTITVTGSSFPADATVAVGGAVVAGVVVQDSGTLVVTVPASSVVGAVDVTVTNPSGGSGTLSDALTYTNAPPAAAITPLSSPQSQNVVIELTLSDPESDAVDLLLEVSTDGGGSYTAVPADDVVSGGLSGFATAATGRVHRITWDSRGLFPNANPTGLLLRVTPTDTTDGQVGPAATSSPFDVENNTPVTVDLVQPGADAFTVALAYTVADDDPTDAVQVTALTWRDARTGVTGPMTVKTGQDVGLAPFSAAGTLTRTVWDSLADLGYGNNKLIEVTVTVGDGTTTTSATSAPFFVSNGPLSDQRIADTGGNLLRAAAVGDFLSAERRLALGAVTGGAFLVGEAVVGSVSGTTAQVTEVGQDFLVVDSESGFFDLAAPDVLTGAVSGASAPLLGQAGFPVYPDLLGTAADNSIIALIPNSGLALEQSTSQTLPDLPGGPGGSGGEFDEVLPRPDQCAVVDANGDDLRDLVVVSSRYGAFSGTPLLQNAAAVFAAAGADAGNDFANVIAHQRSLSILQQAGALLAPVTGDWRTTQARVDAIAPHLPASGFPTALTADEGQDNIGWFVQDVVAADLDPPGAPGHGKEDLLLLHGVRQLTAALGGDPRSAITIRMRNLASDPAPLALSATPAYLDPTDMGALATQCAVADITSAAHAASGIAATGVAEPVAAGLPDIAVCNTGDGSLTFYLQLWPAHEPLNPFTGDTTEPLPTFTSWRFPLGATLGLPAGDLRGLATGDLNGDGAADLLVVGQLSRKAFVFVYDPAGTTATTINLDLLSDGAVPLRLAAALDLPEVQVGRPAIVDLTGDGRCELLVPSTLSNDLLVYVNAGAAPAAPPGTTTPTPLFDPTPVRFTTEFQPEEVLLADLNGDNRRDVVVKCALSEDFSAFYQTPPGTLDRFVPVPTGIGPNPIWSGDVTGDGLEDVIVPCNGDNSLQVFSRDPTRLLAKVAEYDLSGPASDGNLASLPFSAAVGDVDGDGAEDDIAVAMEIALPGGVAAVEWIQGGPLAVGVADIRTTTVAPIGFSPAIGPFLGGDAVNDVALSSIAGGVSLFAGDGAGGLSPADPTILGASGLVLQARDLDGDGAIDLIVGAGSGSDVGIYYGDGAGDLEPLTALDSADLSESVSMTIGDFYSGPVSASGRPLLDIVITGFTQAEAAVFYQVAERAFVGFRLPVGGEPAQPAAGDLNGDGLDDLAIPWGRENLVAVYYQNAAPTSPEDSLLPPATLPTANAPIGAAILDVDGDALLDLVVAARGASSLNVFLQR